MNVARQMNKKANGNGAVALFKLTSVIRIIPIKPPKMKNDKIVTAFIMCVIRSTSIVDTSFEEPLLLIPAELQAN